MFNVRSNLAGILRERRGHFELESGHHGNLWLQLESLFTRPSAVRPIAVELANRLRPYDIEVVCGPLVEGAFVGLLVAEEIEADFVYAEREARREGTMLFPFSYRIPDGRRELRNRRVAIANDVINAGSAVLGALADLEKCGAHVIAIGTLLSLGSRAAQLAREVSLPLEVSSRSPFPSGRPPSALSARAARPSRPFPEPKRFRRSSRSCFGSTVQKRADAL